MEHLNSNVMAQRICDLIDNDSLRKKMGAKARRNVQRYNKEYIMKEWMSLFEYLIQQKK